MNDHLDQTLESIGQAFAGRINHAARHYVEVDIGETAEKLGYTDVGRKYQKVLAFVPLKHAQKGMKVRIDGRTFVKYGQLESGVVVPGRVAGNSKLSYKTFVPNDSMILNFA